MIPVLEAGVWGLGLTGEVGAENRRGEESRGTHADCPRGNRSHISCAVGTAILPDLSSSLALGDRFLIVTLFLNFAWQQVNAL